MGAQHEETQHLKIVFLTDLTNSKEIAQRFAHLPVVDVQESVVQPVAGKGLAVAAFALGNLVLMMREDQILAAGMDIDLLTQIFL